MQAGERALVTGGGGFLGKAIVERLLARGLCVRSFARGEYPELGAMCVEVVRGDLGDADAVGEACRDCNLIFHVAAKAGIWGEYDEYHRINVTGTESVVAACRAHKIPRLIYTSSPSAVFDGNDMEGADESVPYPTHFEAHYAKTKAAAERLVLAANDATLGTVALRPHLIWGPGDPHLVPRIVERAKAGQLRLVGDGSNRVDTVYVDNAADAHLLAAERLAPGSPIAGKVYFITNGDPRPLREIINMILHAAGLPPVTKSISPGAAYAIGVALETIHRTLRIQREPRMTRWVARELATAHWFDIAAARRDLGYEPKVSIEEGMRRLKEWMRRKEG